MASLKRKRTTEDIRRRKGIDSFIKSLGTSALEYGKGRLRDYPQEVVSGWKNVLGLTKRVVPESLEGIAPVAESVGGLSVTIPQALKQLGESVGRIGKLGKLGYTEKIPPSKVRDIAANIRRSPEKVLDPITSIKYSKDLGKATGMNVRMDGSNVSSIKLAPSAKADELFHEITHGSSYGVKGEKSLKGYLSDVLETATEKGIGAVEKAKKSGAIKAGRTFYFDQPIERHARLVSRAVKETPGKISSKDFDKIFNIKAKWVINELRQKAPTLYKRTLKDVAKKYKRQRAIELQAQRGKLPDTFNDWLSGITSPKYKSIKQFPSTVRSPEEAVRLGKQYSFKELDDIWKSAERESARLTKAGKFDEAMKPAMKAQGAREAMQTQFQVGRYDFPFERSRFDEWRKVVREGLKR